jgi:hypothetical protein
MICNIEFLIFDINCKSLDCQNERKKCHGQIERLQQFGLISHLSQPYLFTHDPYPNITALQYHLVSNAGQLTT